jgi:hypothetical protein
MIVWYVGQVEIAAGVVTATFIAGVGAIGGTVVGPAPLDGADVGLC